MNSNETNNLLVMYVPLWTHLITIRICTIVCVAYYLGQEDNEKKRLKKKIEDAERRAFGPTSPYSP